MARNGEAGRRRGGRRQFRVAKPNLEFVNPYPTATGFVST